MSNNTLVVYRNKAQLTSLKKAHPEANYFPFDGDTDLLKGMKYTDVLYFDTNRIISLFTVAAIERYKDKAGVEVEEATVVKPKPKRKQRKKKEVVDE